MRVDFYLLNDAAPQANKLFACRLLEKAYYRGHRVFVYCAHQQDAFELDELLWTFKEDSFVPHNLQGEGPEPPPAVQIGYQSAPRGYNDILLNLSGEIPAFHTQFNRLIEIVAVDDTAKETARTHFRAYRQLGYTLNTHTLQADTKNTTS